MKPRPLQRLFILVMIQLAAAAATSGGGAQPSTPPQERSELLQRGEAALARGDAGHALDAFERAGTMMHAPDTELGLVRTYMQSGAYRRALSFAAHTAGAHRDEPAGAVLYAWLLHAGGQTAFAQRVLDGTEVRKPGDALVAQARSQLRSPAPVAIGGLLRVPWRAAPFDASTALPASAYVASSGVLIDGGRRALAPLVEARALWLRDGLGRRSPGEVERRVESLGLVLLRLVDPIKAASGLVLAPRDTFPVEEAAKDPKVLAIKMTLYRVSPTSPIAQALALAAEAGKEVSVLVELQARFDEEANITWARALEKVGAHVVYGLVGFKTHCKICLVVRQEADGIRRYCHLATGNYNARTAGIYSDFGLFTCLETFGQDLTELFNLLTGYTRPQRFNHLILAPVGLREHFLTCIRQEAEHARGGRPARIIVKVNSLIDPAIIEELYLAGQAGVEIDLIVRGMCSLRPGVPGLSERIRVISVIDRYLEHARIFFFHNDGSAGVFLASADWMQRNFDRRVEIAFPVLDEQHQARLKEILEIQLSDNVKGWQIHADGSSMRIASPDAYSTRSQEQLYELTRNDYSGSTTRPPER